MKDKEVENIEEDTRSIRETSKRTTVTRKKWDSGKEMESESYLSLSEGIISLSVNTG